MNEFGNPIKAAIKSRYDLHSTAMKPAISAVGDKIKKADKAVENWANNRNGNFVTNGVKRWVANKYTMSHTMDPARKAVGNVITKVDNKVGNWADS